MKQAVLLAKFLIWRLKHLTNRNFILILAVFIGICGGLTALILKSSVFYMRQLLTSDFEFDVRNYLMLIYPAVGILLAILLNKFIIKDNIKHNITSILHAISKGNSLMRTHKVFSSMLGGVLTAGFGGSIGLEAPIISSGSAIGSNIGRILKLNYKTVTLLLACGSAGAMSAIFNTPIAAVVFAFEVLLIDLSRFSLIPLLMSSVTGTIITRIFYSEEILFNFSITDSYTMKELPLYFIFGIISGFAALYFTKTFLFFETKFEKIQKQRKRFLYGAIGLGILIFLFPPLFGEGFQTIKMLFSGNTSMILNNSIFHNFKDNEIVVILFFLILILIKVIATVFTTGAGGIGGVFAPSLFTGALLGFVFATVLNEFGIDVSVSNFILIGMAGMLAGVLHAPLTAMFMIAEITSGYHLIVPLMFSVSIAYVTAKYIEPNTVFTMRLAQKGELVTHHKDKAVLIFMELHSLIEDNFKPIHAEATLGDLVKVIANSSRNIFPVLGDNQQLLGIVLLDDVRDIMFDSSLYKTTYVRNLMTHPPSVINSTDTMETVMKKFKETNAWNLPVINKGKYLGFVSKSKMFSVYRQLLVDITDD